MKRLFTFVFALLNAYTFFAYAAIVEGICGDNLTWTLNTKDSTLVISGIGEITYPSSWSKYDSYIKYVTIEDGVTSIGDWAFLSCSLTSIAIPKSVMSIGSYAFEYCCYLESVHICDLNAWCRIDFKSVGANPLDKTCPDPSLCNISKLYLNNKLIEELVIPDGITTIKQYAFAGCSSLESVTIPNSVTNIENSAFGGCTSLTSITIPNSVTSIGDVAFWNCSSLTSITIPNSVTSIGYRAFASCDSLTSIIIGNSVTSIGEEAFDGCSSLTFVTIGNSVTSIGDAAFRSCSSLTSITIPNSVTTIGGGAFSSCNNIKEVTAYMPTPPDARSCGINPAAVTLYVPAEYLDIYSNTLWWEDFAKIRAIGSDWNVTFVDWDNTTLATMKVPNGSAATAPADPTRKGYTFIGWDKDFSVVTNHMTITAQYQINRYHVRFLDFDGTLLHTDSVEYHAAAVAPADPYRAGYTFTGWDKAFDSITADLDVYAQYEIGEDHDITIVFTNTEDNNSEILSQAITIKIPASPEIEGFTFIGWKVMDAFINDVITIQAIYEANVPSSAPEVYTNPANPAQKLLRNGQVYILQDGKTYTITGQEL